MEKSSSFHGVSSTVGAAIVAVLAVIFVGLRFYARKRYKSGIAWDDWWILIGLLITLLEGVNVETKARNATIAAAANKTTAFDTAKHGTYFKLSFLCSILYFSNVTAIKVSILLMYRRLFYIDRNFRRQSMLVGIVVLAFWLAGTIAAICSCSPMRFVSVNPPQARKCFNFNIFWMVTGVVEVVMDSVILAMPVRMVLGLHLPRGRKISVLCIFLLGSFVIVTGILRVVYGYVPGSQSPSLTRAGLWSAVHVGMAIVCACLPSLRPFLNSASTSISNTTSSLQGRYSPFRPPSSKTSIGSNPSAGSKTEDRKSAVLKTGEMADVIPQEFEEPYCGASLKDPRVELVYLEAGRVSPV